MSEAQPAQPSGERLVITGAPQLSTGLGRTSFDGPGTAPPAAEDGDRLARELPAGTLLADRYEVRSRVGAGGMGAVYRVFDRLRGREVALKVMLPSLLAHEEALARFRHEAELLLSLEHPGIIRVFDVGHDEPRRLRFFTMALLDGETLRARLDRARSEGKVLEPREALEIGRQLLEALSHAHRRGVVHRDLSPENIFVVADGAGAPAVKVLDFGLAKVGADSHLTGTDTALGKAYYMAPEQRRNAADVDLRADLYSVSVILYEMLTGTLPEGRFKTPSQERATLPRQLDEMILRGLEPRPEARPQSADRLIAEIAALRGLFESVRERKGRFGPLVGLGAALALVLVLALGVVASGRLGGSGGPGGDDVIRPLESEPTGEKDGPARPETLRRGQASPPPVGPSSTPPPPGGATPKRSGGAVPAKGASTLDSPAPARDERRTVLVAPFENVSGVRARIIYEAPTGDSPDAPKRRFEVDRYTEAPRGILEDILVGARIQVVERQRVDAMLQESQFNGLREDAQGIELGKLVGASVVIMGTVLSIGETEKTFQGYGVNVKQTVVKTSIRVRAIEIATGAILASRVFDGSREFTSSQFGGAKESDVAFKVMERALQKAAADEGLLAAARGPKAGGAGVSVLFQPAPENCDVVIDGVYAGGSPLTVPLPADRAVKVQIRKAGFEPWESTIVPRPGQAPIKPELVREK